MGTDKNEVLLLNIMKKIKNLEKGYGNGMTHEDNNNKKDL